MKWPAVDLAKVACEVPIMKHTVL